MGPNCFQNQLLTQNYQSTTFNYYACTQCTVGYEEFSTNGGTLKSPNGITLDYRAKACPENDKYPQTGCASMKWIS